MRNKRWMIRGLVGAALAALVVVGVVGCWWLINVVPQASFTVSALSGTAPLTVNFSGILSSDKDGTIKKYEWDFGDGGSAVGEAVSHTFNTAGSFPVVLRVTDDGGATDTATQTIVVLPAEEPGGGTGSGPTVSFTATPLTGQVPLTVTFNASASSYPGHELTSYTWNFGDATTGTGITTTHIYGTAGTYVVVLTVIASDNTSRTARQTIIATPVPVTPPTAAPTASFTVNPNTALAPGTITFDPAASSAAAGRTLATYVWTFGDGATYSSPSDTAVTHTYYTPLASKVYTATLTVLDDLNNVGSVSKSVTIKDWQPIAGFEMKQQTASWGVARVVDLTFNAVGGDVRTVSLRSLDATNWTLAPLPKVEGTKPANFETAPYTSGDKNLSYDPEGQSLAQGWGITTYVWNFDGGVPTTPGTTRPANANGGCDEFAVTFQLGTTENSRTFNVSVTVIDAQGAQSTKTRKVILNRT